jgi:hypothetical protein
VNWVPIPPEGAWFNLDHAEKVEIKHCGLINSPRFEVWAHHRTDRVTILHSADSYEEALEWAAVLLGQEGLYE